MSLTAIGPAEMVFHHAFAQFCAVVPPGKTEGVYPTPTGLGRISVADIREGAEALFQISNPNWGGVIQDDRLVSIGVVLSFVRNSCSHIEEAVEASRALYRIIKGHGIDPVGILGAFSRWHLLRPVKDAKESPPPQRRGFFCHKNDIRCTLVFDVDREGHAERLHRILIQKKGYQAFRLETVYTVDGRPRYVHLKHRERIVSERVIAPQMQMIHFPGKTVGTERVTIIDDGDGSLTERPVSVLCGFSHLAGCFHVQLTRPSGYRQEETHLSVNLDEGTLSLNSEFPGNKTLGVRTASVFDFCRKKL
jgi:hypothetical protein